MSTNWIRDRSAAGVNGLMTNSLTPAVRASSTSRCERWAVTMITGTSGFGIRRSGWTAARRIERVSSSPPISGMFQSEKMMSGSQRASISRARRPSSANSTKPTPPARSTSPIRRCTLALSSTISSLSCERSSGRRLALGRLRRDIRELLRKRSGD
ncbi:hypothetical protein LRS04_24270 [Phenylobacterium sp. J367]|nr:hypothetical protein [Phenylobacterium sp. J367]MCR5881034.1 hypothetical protein [Phenylobacterium sp. J367]